MNNSYLKHWSPVYATCDSTALGRDYDRANALAFYSGTNPRKVGKWAVNPHKLIDRIVYYDHITIARSGTFAYWLALQCFKATKVRLVGFDMDWRQGHFDTDDVQPVNYDDHTKPVLEFWYDEFRVPTKIWRDGWVDLKEAL